MTGDRWRIHQVQNDGPEHVSSVVLGDDEVADHIKAEATLHQAAGWVVRWLSHLEIVAARQGETRRVWAVQYDPQGKKKTSLFATFLHRFAGHN